MRPALPWVLVFLLVSPANAQSLPSKREAAVLLQKAIDAANLNLGGAAFHLLTKIHYEAYGNASDGTYELLWAAPDRFREEFRVDTAGETDVVLGDKRYVLRNTSAMHLALGRLRTVGFLDAPLRFLGGPDSHVSKVYSTRPSPGAEVCVKADTKALEYEACFDSASFRILSAKVALKNNRPEFERRVDDFIALGAKRYPRHQLFHLQTERIEAKVDKLEETSQFAESVFVPPPGAIVFDWCSEATQQGSLNPLRPPIPFPFENLVYYLVVGTDGVVVKSIPLAVASQKSEQIASRWFQETRFPIRLCHGKPIEYERIYEEHAPVLLSPR